MHMKTLLVLGLVLLLLVVGLPLAMGMGDMAPCPACSAPDAHLAIAMCLAIFAMGAVFMSSSLSRRMPLRSNRIPEFLALSSLDRPPQHA